MSSSWAKLAIAARSIQSTIVHAERSPFISRRRGEPECSPRTEAVRRAPLELAAGRRSVGVDRTTPRSTVVAPCQRGTAGPATLTRHPAERPPTVEVFPYKLGMRPHRIVGFHRYHVEGLTAARAAGSTVQGVHATSPVRIATSISRTQRPSESTRPDVAGSGCAPRNFTLIDTLRAPHLKWLRHVRCTSTVETAFRRYVVVDHARS